MITAVSAFGVYLLKATLFSGILYAYYHFALRDKQTFGWNRFYLLASAQTDTARYQVDTAHTHKIDTLREIRLTGSDRKSVV